jgi:hypothetical protein
MLMNFCSESGESLQGEFEIGLGQGWRNFSADAPWPWDYGS